MSIDIRALQQSASPLEGNVSGVYFLFNNDELVYIGQGWNCLLRVAEHTRKDSGKKFTHWSFMKIDSEADRKNLEMELRKKYSPKFNKV